MNDNTELEPACAYIRVSTRRQAEHETSLQEQEVGTQRAAAHDGRRIVRTYIESGRSGMNDRRPALQQMVADASAQPRPYKAVYVYNFSRFFRDEFEFEGYRRRLEKVGCKLISATQDIGEGPQARIFRSFLTTIDAVSSEINAAQVKVVMTANASAGFWNGAALPLGYSAVVAERRGKKDKKVLAINDAEAAIVLIIFALYLDGINGCGPLGIKKIVGWLIARGYSHRNQPFSISLIHTILTRETYAGRHYYNRTDSRTKQKRPRDEWIEVVVPVIVPHERFDAVQRRLAARNPAISAPRSHDSPVLLSGRTRCGRPECGGTMMLMTGKSGQYRYYTCSNRRRKADIICRGNTVSMPLVDNMVVEALEKRLFQTDRLHALLRGVLDASNSAEADRRKRLGTLRAEETETEKARRALFGLVEAGTTAPDDPILKERLQTLKVRQQAVALDIKRLENQLGTKSTRITPKKVELFAQLMRRKLRDASDPQMRKRYIEAFVHDVEMTPECIIIRGPVNALEHGAFASDLPPTKVRTFVGEWCTRLDSNQ
jgi:site-specific DNA recombinase